MRVYVLIAALAVAAFGLSVAGSFHFDDYSLFRNPAVVSPDGWRDLFRPEQTRPLTYLTFWLNYRAGGEDPAGYHLVNLALHVGAALLLLRVARRAVPPNAAIIAAAVFAVHPILTEPVAYIFARGTLLMTVFCLLSLDAWLRDRRWIAVAWFAAAVFAKEECAAFPVFLLLLDLSCARRLRGIGPIAAMGALALAAGLRVIWALNVTPGSQAGAGAGITPAGYLAVQGPVMLRYFRQLLLPWNFSVDPQIGPFPAWAEIAAWAAIAAAVIVAARRFRETQAGFWLIAAIVLLLPSSSIFPAADLAADRRMYLPFAMLAVGAGLLLERFRWQWLAILLAVLCAISMRYSEIWRTEKSLWEEAVRLAPSKVRPRIQLARAVEPGRALQLLTEAEKHSPGDPAIESEKGRVYLSTGMAVEALGSFGRALALDPGNPEAIQNRGVALYALGQKMAAQQDFELALERDPCLFEARLNLTRITGRSQAPPARCRFTPAQMAELENPGHP